MSEATDILATQSVATNGEAVRTSDWLCRAGETTPSVATGMEREWSGRSLLSLVCFDPIPLAEANACLVKWGHKMGPCTRGNACGWSHALMHEGRPVAVTITASLIRECVGGGAAHLTRDNTIELARLCAERSGLNRVALRLWREFVFPALGYEWAMSYQDAKEHTGNTYRFDGWTALPGLARSGTDSRSSRTGRTKRVWVWRAAGAGVGLKPSPTEARHSAEVSDGLRGRSATE